MDLEEERKAEARVVGGREGEVSTVGGRQSRVRSRRRQRPHLCLRLLGPREMEALKARLFSVEEERDAAVRANRMQEASHHAQQKRPADIPLMPVHVPKDLDDWMRDRNLDLQEALSLGDGPRGVKVDLEVVRGGCTNVHFDWCHAELDLAKR